MNVEGGLKEKRKNNLKYLILDISFNIPFGISQKIGNCEINIYESKIMYTIHAPFNPLLIINHGFLGSEKFLVI